uniref:Uncharacterized protein n=1 Tax=Arundo donax TaxID=35708 RepID=A0A0A9BAM1_ARUDO
MSVCCCTHNKFSDPIYFYQMKKAFIDLGRKKHPFLSSNLFP